VFIVLVIKIMLFIGFVYMCVIGIILIVLFFLCIGMI
jgi:hypothetical protein